MRLLSILLAVALFLPASGGATTPAAWLIDFSRCEGEQAEMELARMDRRLTRSEARSLAVKILWACETFMPAEMSFAERHRYVKSHGADFARSLRYHSKVGTYAQNR